MARFDYKKWITEQKYGKPSPPTNDKLEPRGELNPRDPESAGRIMLTCAQIYANADFSTFSCTDSVDCCHRFSLCLNGASNNSEKPRAINGSQDPHIFYDRMCPNGCNIDDVMEDNVGNIWIYDGNPDDTASPVPIYPHNINYLAPASCTPPIGGCIDPLANNENPNANADCQGVVGGTDTSCCGYGYKCHKRTSPQDHWWLAKRSDDQAEIPLQEWAPTYVCIKEAPGNTLQSAQYPDKHSCKNSGCEGYYDREIASPL